MDEQDNFVCGAPIDPPDGETLAEIASLIVTLSRYIQDNENRLEGVVELRPLEVMVLRTVEQHPGIAPGQIATRLRLRASNTSAALRVLEERGLVARAAHAQDARSVQVTITQLARQSIDRVRAADRAFLSPVLPDDVDARALLQLLRRTEEGLTG